jgi:hypothetical protein
MAKKISIIERRLQGPNVFRTSSRPIPLTEGDLWTVRWENSKISPQHMQSITSELGWEYATPADIACGIDEIGAFERDGRVVRGERGDEVLMKMRTKDYRQIQKKKTEETNKQTFGRKQLKQAVVSGVAAEHGDQAAAFMQKHMDSIGVSDSRGPADE